MVQLKEFLPFKKKESFTHTCRILQSTCSYGIWNTKNKRRHKSKNNKSDLVQYAIWKYRGCDLYLLPPSLYPSNPLDTMDQRYINFEHAPILNPLKKPLRIEINNADHPLHNILSTRTTNQNHQLTSKPVNLIFSIQLYHHHHYHHHRYFHSHHIPLTHYILPSSIQKTNFSSSNSFLATQFEKDGT